MRNMGHKNDPYMKTEQKMLIKEGKNRTLKILKSRGRLSGIPRFNKSSSGVVKLRTEAVPVRLV